VLTPHPDLTLSPLALPHLSTFFYLPQAEVLRIILLELVLVAWCNQLEDSEVKVLPIPLVAAEEELRVLCVVMAAQAATWGQE
jgi:hypothetical protein